MQLGVEAMERGVVCVKARQQSITTGGVPMHYSNAAAAALEKCIGTPPARAHFAHYLLAPSMHQVIIDQRKIQLTMRV